MDKIGFIGAGNMAEALVRGIINSGKVKSRDVFVTDISAKRTEYMAKVYTVNIAKDAAELCRCCGIIVLSVKPQNIQEVLGEIAGELDRDKTLISIAAGVTTEKISAVVGQEVPLIRVMPNTPALVGKAMSALYTQNASTEAIQDAVELFFAVGKAITVNSESQIDAVTAVSGSGPAYFFLLMEEMITAAVKLGIEPDKARKLVLQTAAGAAELAISADKDGIGPEQLRKNVTSPGGTTEAALNVFKKHDFADIIYKAIEAADERSKNLS